MPIRVYLQIIGHTTVIKGLEDCLKNNLTIEELPEHIRREIFNRRIFSPKLNYLSTILRTLKVLEVNSVSILELNKEAEIVDDTVSPNVIKKYTFEGLSDVMRYWTELEYISLHKSLEEQDTEETTEAPSMSDSTKPFSLQELRIPTYWQIRKPISRSQRQLLETYKFDEIPSKEECRTIATAAQLSFGQVYFFFKHRVARQKRILEDPTYVPNVPKAKKPKRDKSEIEQTQQLFIKRSRKPKAPVQQAEIDTNISHSQAFKSKNNKKRKEMETEAAANNSEEEDEEEEEESGVSTKVAPERGYRAFWSTEEDNLLLQAFISFSTSDKLVAQLEQWGPIAKKLDKPNTACERRFRHLLKVENCKKAMKVAVAEKFMDPTKNLGELPKTVGELLNKYNVKDLLETTSSSTAITITNGCLAELIKILLLTPEQELPPEKASDIIRLLFSNYHEHEIRQAFVELRQLGVITKNKTTTSSRSHQFSVKFHRFIRSLAPFHPNLFQDAESFMNSSIAHFKDNKYLEYQGFYNGGSTASVLAGVANKRVRNHLYIFINNI